MTEDTSPENLRKFRKNLRKFMDNESTVKIDEETLVGAAIWYDFTEKERDSISKKLLIDPKEMVAKYWINVENIDSKDLNLTKKLKDNYYYNYNELERCKRKMKCRGCRKEIVKGELRWAVTALETGFWGSTNHYFCIKCATRFIKPTIRYKLIKTWWETNGWIRLSKASKRKDTDYLIKMLEDKAIKHYEWTNVMDAEIQTHIKKNWKPRNAEIRNVIIEMLGNLGDKKALNPLIEIIDKNDLGIVATSLSKIVGKNKLENSKEILKFLKSNDEGMKRMGTSMLKGILEA